MWSFDGAHAHVQTIRGQKYQFIAFKPKISIISSNTIKLKIPGGFCCCLHLDDMCAIVWHVKLILINFLRMWMRADVQGSCSCASCLFFLKILFFSCSQIIWMRSNTVLCVHLKGVIFLNQFYGGITYIPIKCTHSKCIVQWVWTHATTASSETEYFYHAPKLTWPICSPSPLTPRRREKLICFLH